LDRAVDTMDHWIATGAREYVCITGMHGVMESRADPKLREIHNASGLTTPDGMPMVWAGRRVGAPISRVYGPDLMEAVFAEAVRKGWTHYFLGGAPGVGQELVAKMVERFPGLVIAGTNCPPFRQLTAEEDAALVETINQAGPDIVWVCLGTPKQEHWMAVHRESLNASVLVGVGAAFDLLAGTLRQAPKWMQHNGLEWLYRLAVEPKRLWRRYLLNIPRFLIGMAIHPPVMMTSRPPGE
jgi:N-acetylglucosaminyldiphosphoundecaprenol N-acetyl-beta-D-mannosaminyltransferase